jgi:hypothetical protein
MVNPGEASLNVVITDKPKVLLQNGDSRARHAAAAKSGLGQKARGQVRGFRTPPAQMSYHRRRDATYTTLVVPPAERGKPVGLLFSDSKGSRKMT